MREGVVLAFIASARYQVEAITRVVVGGVPCEGVPIGILIDTEAVPPVIIGGIFCKSVAIGIPIDAEAVPPIIIGGIVCEGVPVRAIEVDAIFVLFDDVLIEVVLIGIIEFNAVDLVVANLVPREGVPVRKIEVEAVSRAIVGGVACEGILVGTTESDSHREIHHLAVLNRYSCPSCE